MPAAIFFCEDTPYTETKLPGGVHGTRSRAWFAARGRIRTARRRRVGADLSEPAHHTGGAVRGGRRNRRPPAHSHPPAVARPPPADRHRDRRRRRRHERARPPAPARGPP